MTTSYKKLILCRVLISTRKWIKSFTIQHLPDVLLFSDIFSLNIKAETALSPHVLLKHLLFHGLRHKEMKS